MKFSFYSYEARERETEIGRRKRKRRIVKRQPGQMEPSRMEFFAATNKSFSRKHMLSGQTSWRLSYILAW